MFRRKLRSVLTALLAISPFTLVLAVTQFAGLGVAMLPAAAVAGWLIAPPARAQGAIKAGVFWGLVAAASSSVLFGVGQTLVVELSGSDRWYFPRLDTTPDIYITFVIVEVLAVAAILAVPLSILGVAWAVIAHALERFLSHRTG